jgi:hypothetical protein
MGWARPATAISAPITTGWRRSAWRLRPVFGAGMIPPRIQGAISGPDAPSAARFQGGVRPRNPVNGAAGTPTTIRSGPQSTPRRAAQLTRGRAGAPPQPGDNFDTHMLYHMHPPSGDDAGGGRRGGRRRRWAFPGLTVAFPGGQRSWAPRCAGAWMSTRGVRRLTTDLTWRPARTSAASAASRWNATGPTESSQYVESNVVFSTGYPHADSSTRKPWALPGCAFQPG